MVRHRDNWKFVPQADRELLVIHLADNLARKMGFSPYEEGDRPQSLEAGRVLGMVPGQLSEIVREVKTFVLRNVESF